MTGFYISFYTSEGIADRGEVSYDEWHRWIAEDYIYGPYDAIVCVYNTIEGFIERTGERVLANLINDPGDRFDGYWRVVKRVVTKRFTWIDAWRSSAIRAGQPRAYSHPSDEMLPPFSDWFIDAKVSGVPRSIREIDAYQPARGQLGSVDSP